MRMKIVRNRLSNESGVSLIETLLALVLAAVVMIAFVHATMSQRQQIQKIELQELSAEVFYRTIQSILATQLLAESTQWPDAVQLNADFKNCRTSDLVVGAVPEPNCYPASVGDGFRDLYLAFPPENADPKTNWSPVSGGSTQLPVFYSRGGKKSHAIKALSSSFPIQVITEFLPFCANPDNAGRCNRSAVVVVRVTLKTKDSIKTTLLEVPI